jgi:hypothetical protein
MGMIIAGWVEVRPKSYDPISPWREDRRWLGIVRIAPLIRLDYDAFVNLFSLEQYRRFPPLERSYGIPDDASEEVERDWERAVAFNHREGVTSPGWIVWPAFARMDWDEESERRSLFRYRRDDDGNLVEEGPPSWTPEYHAQVFNSGIGESILVALYPSEERSPPDCLEWEIDGILYRARPLKRKELIGDDWRMLCKMMEALAAQYGEDGVRLVAWFVHAPPPPDEEDIP